MAIKLLGNIVARIAADPSGFVTGVDRARGKSKEFENSIGGLKTALAGLATAFSAGALRSFIADQVAAIDATAKFATRIGESFESMGRLGFIAERSGIQITQMQTAVQRLTRRTGEAMQGNTELLKTFERLNINVREFADLDIVEKLIAIDQATGQLNTREEQLATLMKLVDTEGIALIQSFDGQGRALADLAAQYDASGMTITDEQARMVEAVSDAWTDISTEWGKASQVFIAEIAPGLIEAMKFIGDASFRLAGGIRVAWNTITTTVRMAAKFIVDDINKMVGSETLQGISEALEVGIITDQEDMAQGFKLIMEGMQGVGVTANRATKDVTGFVDELGKLSGSAGRGGGRGRRGRLPSLPRAESPEFENVGLDVREGFEEQAMMRELDEIFEDINATLEEQAELYAEIDDVMGDFVGNAIRNWKDLGSVLKDFETQILDRLMQKLVVGPLTDAITGAIGGAISGGGKGGGGGGFFSGLLGTIFSPSGRAGGGFSTQPFVAGETGPELVIPNPGGASVMRMNEGSSGNVVVNMNISTPDAASFLNPRSRSQMENAARGIGTAAHRSRAM